ncbi:conserved hypothetical protein [Neospora caninum Liverpool]|uniref:Uncharacterized protein n=1 Tax=Neospora caninum (strain Liverpool) TaxID=572307 RepID=F0VI71_NEOCL|nr:conserved hypothetical protein [Neospora caninum Liverpool]CBZ53432.1 conserved hypothetical protein [Neospora caninum Liverpool]CEL67419.1 TPA: hypothetical protein BN1204_032190 [Neospora caninum Liverpool]|eukprot:XP_003883464.1 conserved hypothetical protein [Neospora caninum Liverpool]
MELLTSFVDETACNTCFGNLILVSAACTALDCIEQAKKREVHPDNLVMALDVITFAVRKLHPQCFDNTETEQLRSAALSAFDAQMKQLLNNSSCKPIVKAQVTGIQLALDHLTRQSSILALQNDVEAKTSRTRFLRTISGFWKVRMPLALQRMSSYSG